MTDASRTEAGFNRSTFDQVQTEIVQIAERLPRAVIVDLAQEVVARLAARATTRVTIAGGPSDADIDALCRALVSDDKEAAARLITQEVDAGVDVEKLYLEHLAVAAQRLGAWWETDRVGYASVMLAAARIYAIMLSLRRSMPQSKDIRGRSAVLASVPGDTHTLGVTMASDLLRNKGWDIDLKVGRTHEQLVEEIEASDCAVIGLSGASRRSLLPLMRLIVALRICKPGAKIMVSGQIVSGVDLVRTAGADEIASDFTQALAAMERLAGFA
jgi:MerR family transcriptional regulator, light-induced transcriptional regulator